MRLADVEFSTHERVLVAHVTGEIDLSNAERIGTALTDAIQNDLLALVLDLSDLDYLDSAGIRLIYRLQENLRARGQAFRLVIPNGSPVKYALRLAGLNDHVETLETIDAAFGGTEPLTTEA